MHIHDLHPVNKEKGHFVFLLLMLGTFIVVINAMWNALNMD